MFFLAAAAASCLLGAPGPAIAGDEVCEAPEPEPGRAVSTYDPFIVFFDSGSAAITPQTSTILDNVAAVSRVLPPCRLIIGGHADRAGSAAYNLALSRRRAEAILAHLRRLGVNAKARIEYVGEGRPMVETEDGVAEPQNRFATIFFAPHQRP